jgi:hypothetical protein
MQRELEISIEDLNRQGWLWWQEKLRQEEAEDQKEDDQPKSDVIIIQM